MKPVRATSLADRLSAELAELSDIVTRRCTDIFAAAHRGGPERATLAARGHELQALQTELAAHMPAAADGDTHAISRVITLQRHTLALLDTLQGVNPGFETATSERALDFPGMRDFDPRPDIVTMHPASGPEGQTLWVADPARARHGADAPSSQDTARAIRSRAPPAPSPTAQKTSAVLPSRPQRQDARRNKASESRGEDAEVRPTFLRLLLNGLSRQLGTGAQIAAAGAVVLALLATTASLVPTIANRLQATPQEDGDRPKPSERLPAAIAKAAEIAPTPPRVAVAAAEAAGPSAGPGYVAVVATHDSYAAARQAFVTLKGLYPVPLANTAPDIRAVKGPGFKNLFELALLPALERTGADDLCRRLLGLGHITCIVKRQP